MLLIQTWTEADAYWMFPVCGIIIIYSFYMTYLKKVNPKKHEKITSIVWGVIAIIFLAWIYNKWKHDNKDKK